MIEAWQVVSLALAYVGALFALAWFGDRTIRTEKGGKGRPLAYSLSIAVYCTSWTFFGSVGLAATTGYSFLPVYLGAIIAWVFGYKLILRIVRLAKSQNITSVADFLASRYGKSQPVAAVVTIIAVIGTLPYLALQMKAVALSVDILLGPETLGRIGVSGDTAFIIAMSMAAFAVLFGTRHIDATEHQHGMMLAIAAESIVKLAAFLTVGYYVMYRTFGSVEGFFTMLGRAPKLSSVFENGIEWPTWITVTLLSFFAIILLPRQFHVTVVENNSEAEIKRARWLFPLYLVAINLFVVPIAAAGILALPANVAPDTYVLAMPLALKEPSLAIFAFIGGLSTATAMVIVETVALAIMVCNGLFVPLMLRRRLDQEPAERSKAPGDLVDKLLTIRRIAIFAILLLAYGFYKGLGTDQKLASIGLISFAAVAQFAPAFFAGLFWRRATARGAITGMLAGFAVWGYTLLVPWCVHAGLIAPELLTDGPFGIVMLAPQSLFRLQLDPLSHGVLFSLAANMTGLVVASLMKAPEPIERLQAQLFMSEDVPRAMSAPSFRLWRTSISINDLQATAARYLGAERAERSFAEYASSRNITLHPSAEADVHMLRFTEHLLASAIGAASSRLVLSLLIRRGNVGSQSAMRLLDDASEALQYNRDLLQSAIDQVRHGLSVFDKDMRLICWNRQFRELLDVPSSLARVGAPLDQILRATGETGGIAAHEIDAWLTDRLMRLAIRQESFHEYFDNGKRIIEIRTSPMPQGGIVTTYLDITERVFAADELARANETLERRVRERTAELTEVNRALAVAKSKADEANLDKTRFLAAASHDVLQPLNAARLYASSLVERKADTDDAGIARNIDTSLEAVEEILGALIDIARLDTGRMDPELSTFPLSELLDQMRVEFEPLAKERGLTLKVMPSSLWVRSDRRLLRRVVQNLLANALKYTTSGGVVLGVRRATTRGLSIARIQVSDTGPGIPQSKQKLIFKEFQRLEETATSVRGLGLGLSIVDRIGRMLSHRIDVISHIGKGSTFSVEVPRAAASAVAPAPTQAPQPLVAALTGITALCIDNEATVLDGMETLLTGWGCQVVKASSAAAAIEALKAKGIAPDVILADYHLDLGNGLDAITAVRTGLALSVPAVVITADNSPDVQRDVRGAGHSLLRKPVKAAALRALITQLTLRRAVAAE